jgi:RNA polymerase sigma-70 factor (ECF subfamily)
MTVATQIEGFDLSEGDKTLAARFASGEAGALEEVIRLYQGRVARLAQRLLGWKSDADDIVQDVFLDALLGARRFRTDATLWTWLSKITVNRCRRRARRVAVKERFLQLLPRSPRNAEPSAAAAAITHERRTAIRRALANLPTREREAAVLFYLEGRSIDESSQILSATPNAVAVRLHRAREKLAVSLRPLMAEDMK